MNILTLRSRTLQFHGCHRPGYSSLVDLRIFVYQLLSSPHRYALHLNPSSLGHTLASIELLLCWFGLQEVVGMGGYKSVLVAAV